MIDAWSGQPQPLQRQVLSLYLTRLDLIESQMAELEKRIAEAMQAHKQTIARLAELPGLGVDSAQQIIAEIGPRAAAFPSAPPLASWVGVCPGRQESAGNPAATVPPRVIARCAGSSINLPTPQLGRRALRCRSSFGV